MNSKMKFSPKIFLSNFLLKFRHASYKLSYKINGGDPERKFFASYYL